MEVDPIGVGTESLANSLGEKNSMGAVDKKRLVNNDVGVESLVNLVDEKIVEVIGSAEVESKNLANSIGDKRFEEDDMDVDSDGSIGLESGILISSVGEERPPKQDVGVDMDVVGNTGVESGNVMNSADENILPNKDSSLDYVGAKINTAGDQRVEANNVVKSDGEQILQKNDEQRPQENDDPMDSVTSTEEKVGNSNSVGEQRPQENDVHMDYVTTTDDKSEHLTNPVGEQRPVEERPQNNDVLTEPVSSTGVESGKLISVGHERPRENTEVKSVVGREGVENLTTSVGEKRVAEISVGDFLRHNKKARVNTSGDMKRVAEIVLVLSAVGNMRGGRSPTASEKEIMAEAREKLSGLCEGIAPKDIVPRDAVRVVIEDLGLNRTKDQRLCFRPPTTSIKEKLLLNKTKMEESKKFGVQPGKYSSQLPQGGFGAKESHSGFIHSAHRFPSEKPSHVAVSGGPEMSLSTNHSNDTQITRGAFGNSLERDASSLPLSRTEPMHFRLDGRSNVSAYAPQIRATNASGDHLLGKAQTYSAQAQQGAVPRVGLANKVPDHKVEGKPVVPGVDRNIISHSSSSQTGYGSMQAVQKPSLHGLNFVQPAAPSAAAHTSAHNEIAKTVQKFLHPKVPDHPSWTPPSTDYMNKSLTCQACKASVNDTETLLVCDACEKGHHLKCLQSYNQKGIPKGEWHCPNCLIASNGKPLPPKYGRVTRNSSAPKAAPVHKVENLSDRKATVAANGDSLRPVVKMSSNSAPNNSSSSSLGNNRLKMEDVHLSSVPKNNNNTSEQQQQQPPPKGEAAAAPHKLVPPSPSSVGPSKLGGISSSSVHNSNTNKLVVESSEVRKDGQDGAHQLGNGGKSSSSSSLVDGLPFVDWIGERDQVVDEKAYYKCCRINGVVYKLQDHALFRSNNGNLRPSKLQSLWEDTKTGSKWAIVNSCYLPADLPEVVGRPCSPENNEVYESNHGSTVRAGLIQGPCEVLPPNKFKEETERSKDHLLVTQPVFLCKWFYDESKGLFRPVTD